MSDVPQDEVFKKLKEYVNQFETKTEAAKGLNISPQYLNDLLARTRPISDSVAQKFGYRKVDVYKKIEN